MKNYQRRSLGSGDEKGPCRFHVRDGSYTLEVSSMGWSGTTNWISAPWSRSQTAEIEPKTEEQRVTLTVPDVGAVARFDGRLSGNVAPSAWSIQARYVDVDGEEQVISLDLDEETRTFTLLVDTAHVQSPTIDFVEDLGADRQPLLHAAELRPGEHSIVLVPTGG